MGQKEIETFCLKRGIRAPGPYHAIIKRNGQVEKGRPIEQQGAGARGYNEDSIHIVLVGGLKEDGMTIWDRKRLRKWGTPDANFTRAQYASLEAQLDSYLLEFPDAEVEGHRDIPGVAKACPCFDVVAWYGKPVIG